MNIGDRIKAARREKGKGFGQQELAIALRRAGLKGASRNWVANVENGRRKTLYPEEVTALAIVLNKEAEYFERKDETASLVNERSTPSGGRYGLAPVRGYVSAGGDVEYEPGEPPRGWTGFEIDLTTVGNDDILQVGGDSMAPTVCPGDYISVRRAQEIPHHINGKLPIMVVRVDGQTMLKRVEKKGDLILLHSDNPKLKPRREAAAHVEILAQAKRLYPPPRAL